MEPTVGNGARISVRTTDPYTPEREDVIVLTRAQGEGSTRQMIRRVIALPGETVEITDCVVSIDGQPLDEPYLDPALFEQLGCGPDQAPTQVPAGAVFVLGDNRPVSPDSRVFGPISTDLVVGVVED